MFVCFCILVFVLPLYLHAFPSFSPPLFINDLQGTQESIVAEIEIYCIESATTVIKNEIKRALANQSADSIFDQNILLYPSKCQSLVQASNPNTFRSGVARQSHGNRQRPTEPKKWREKPTRFQN